MVKSSGREAARFALSRARAKAEAAEWAFVLESLDTAVAGIEDAPGSFGHQAIERGIVLELALGTGWSEYLVRTRTDHTRLVRDRLPMAWLAFRAGRIDAARVQAIAEGAKQLTRDDSFARMDQNLVRCAETHSLAELKRWITRFIARVEPVEQVEAAGEARAGREVEAGHDAHGMGYLYARVESHLVAAIQERLRREARRLRAAGDERTLKQIEADLFTAWLLTATGTEPTVHTDIAVTIKAEVLGGLVDGVAESYDGTWNVPADWVLGLLKSETTLWHRMILDPAGKVLDHTYHGRFVPDVLDKALEFRDQVSRSPGSVTPARRADKDHRQPWPVGQTCGRDMWSLAKRHHDLKGHGVLQWSLRDAPARGTFDADEPGEPAIDFSWPEHRLAGLVLEQQESA